VDRVALEGFANAASAYERARPGWPSAAVRSAFEHWRLAPEGAAVVDLAAGTGRLTSVIVGLGAEVVAVEPVAEMRALIRDATAVDGVAERIPLPAASRDGVFVGEAFHWFDTPAALAEIARVLGPRGGLAIMWNTAEWTEAEQPWRTEVRGLLADSYYHPQGLPLTTQPSDPRRLTTWLRGPGWEAFEPMEERSFEHVQRMTSADYVALVASASFVGALSDDKRAEILRQVAVVLDRHGVDPSEQRWRCNVYLTRRR
jgi:ubiquinone/menaquinone biosynthesis C-methylase UbiE